MALPRIDLPLFELTIPSNGKKVKFRPFTVKEEKILLIARESNDIDQLILAIKQILTNCVVDSIDVNSLAMFDLEYMLLQIRAKSVNDLIEFEITDPETQEKIKLSVNINEIVVKKSTASNVIKLNDAYSIVMRYPTFNELKLLASSTDKTKQEILFDVMTSCIDSLVDGDSVTKMKDFTKQEVNDFVESFSATTITAIKTFFDNIPVLRFEKKYRLKDGTEKTFVLEGIETFFI